MHLPLLLQSVVDRLMHLRGQDVNDVLAHTLALGAVGGARLR
jgi:hypothetical protein